MFLDFIFAYSKHGKAKTWRTRKLVSSLALLTAVSKTLVEQVSKEKKLDISDAQDFVLECIRDGIKTINDK